VIRVALPLLALLGLLLPGAAGAQPARPVPPPVAPPSLAAELSQSRIEVTTAFTGAEILVFGATERLIGEEGDEVLVQAIGPIQPLVVRQKTQLAGLIWVNGASARFNRVPGYWAVAGTRPLVDLLPLPDRQAHRIGLGQIPLVQLGNQGADFRGALAELKQGAGHWVSEAQPIGVSGGRLFHARLPLPATTPTGEYLVQVFLIRDRRILARQELTLVVERSGFTAWIAQVAEDAAVLYGIACILLAALAGWLGSVVFRRG
jgi:uncharacterized protein (TIGR02186 family)